MTISKVLTIVIYFPLSKIKTCKDYFCFLEKYHRSEFKNLCSYKNIIKGRMGFFTGVKFNLIIDFYSNMLGFSIMSGNKGNNSFLEKTIDNFIKQKIQSDKNLSFSYI